MKKTNLTKTDRERINYLINRIYEVSQDYDQMISNKAYSSFVDRKITKIIKEDVEEIRKVKGYTEMKCTVKVALEYYKNKRKEAKKYTELVEQIKTDILNRMYYCSSIGYRTSRMKHSIQSIEMVFLASESCSCLDISMKAINLKFKKWLSDEEFNDIDKLIDSAYRHPDHVLYKYHSCREDEFLYPMVVE